MVIVIKAGHTVTSKADSMRLMRERIRFSKDKVILVVSAMDGVTTRILNEIKSKEAEENPDYSSLRQSLKREHMDLARDLRFDLGGLEKQLDIELRTIDPPLGERMMMQLVTSWLESTDFFVRGVRAYQLGIMTKNVNGEDVLDEDCRTDVGREAYFHLNMNNVNRILVIPGYEARNGNRRVTNLGRGGSDTTAAFVAGALSKYLGKAEKVELRFLKDVAVMSGDPRIVGSKARLLSYLDMISASESGILKQDALRYLGNPDVKIYVEALDGTGKTEIGDERTNEGDIVIKLFRNGYYLKVDVRDEPGQEEETKKLITKRGFNKKGGAETHESTAYFINKSDSRNPSGTIEELVQDIVARGTKVDVEEGSEITVSGGFTKKDYADSVLTLDWKFHSAIYTQPFYSFAIPREGDEQQVRKLHEILVERKR